MSSDERLIIEDGAVFYKIDEESGFNILIAYAQEAWHYGFRINEEHIHPNISSKAPPFQDNRDRDATIREILKKKGVSSGEWEIAKTKMANRAEEIKKACAPKKEGQAEETADIINLIISQGELFHDQFFEPYAAITIEGHREICSLKSKHIRRWLSKMFWDMFKIAPPTEFINGTINVLSAIACFDGNQYTLHNRVARYDEAIWYDMCDERWRAIKITKDGWEIVENPPILFRRYSHQRPQAEPLKAAEIEDFNRLFDFINLKDENNKVLCRGYVGHCIIPDIPHTITWAHGAQGAAKSTFFKCLRRIIDPSTLEVIGAPHDRREFAQTLMHHWFVPLDNITNIPDWLSDMLCRACTGDGQSKRELYTDEDDVIFQYKRCIAINGINIAGRKPDLMDRSEFFELERIPEEKRLREEVFWKRFEEQRPAIFGAILTILSKAMAIVETIKINSLPRMADAAIWGEAICQVMGHEPNEFLKAYRLNQAQQNIQVIQSSVLGELFIEFMQERSEWTGTATQLLNALQGIAEELKIKTTNVKGFPRSATALTRRLNELKTNLIDEGITIEYQRSGEERTVRIYRHKSVAKIPSLTSLRHSQELKLNDAIMTQLKNGTVIESTKSDNDANDENDANLIILQEEDSSLTEFLKEVHNSYVDFCKENNGRGVIPQAVIARLKKERGYSEERIHRAIVELKNRKPPLLFTVNVDKQGNEYLMAAGGKLS